MVIAAAADGGGGGGDAGDAGGKGRGTSLCTRHFSKQLTILITLESRSCEVKSLSRV